MSLHTVPLTRTQANDLIARRHRHHKPVHGLRFAIGLVDEVGQLRGAAVVGRPVARMTDPYRVAEVTRLVTDGVPNGCSMLYQAAARAAKAMGYERIQTFILLSEPGTSLRASGWEMDRTTKPEGWSRPSRIREDEHPTEAKMRWYRQLNTPRL
ncbi:hypothetical protein FHR83_007094 [Actinoplanes campanulatus]|uniref:N-acetyltransferase domain-containing protein n=1 Tax=Actinoplanes campanulatus TaxID=113559 RepID=A0A7W5ANB8_9ACTN|nr:XF1762 family protein [Actinoplanes campanulatus]MBB3099388.1 hypothetical protein [Actinoplanes campanulatus]GGN40197.1 hypothetical protein GCM10010109_68980 [Actinoplanes campanulatus]GID42403.1 hypothetical protein Aca09nite_89090 [Actinoplanes campanulatus]